MKFSGGGMGIRYLGTKLGFKLHLRFKLWNAPQTKIMPRYDRDIDFRGWACMGVKIGGVGGPFHCFILGGTGPEIDKLISAHFDNTVVALRRQKNLIWLLPLSLKV